MIEDDINKNENISDLARRINSFSKLVLYCKVFKLFSKIKRFR